MTTRFLDREQAGAQLAGMLERLALERPIVLALPRGGVPVAAEIARALKAPLDLVLVRKIGMPRQPELALAAVAEGDPPVIVIEERVQRAAGVSAQDIERLARRELVEIARRRQVYLHGRSPCPLAGRTAIVVDDGIATGSTMRAALGAVRKQRPARIVLAVPVAAGDALRSLRAEVDQIVCPVQSESFDAVGEFYRDFHQVDDAEVAAALHRAIADPPGPGAGGGAVGG